MNVQEPGFTRQETSRRTLLRQARWAVAGAAVPGVVAGALAPPAAASGPRPAPKPPPLSAAAHGTPAGAAYDYTSRETFDEFDRSFHEGDTVGQPDDLNEAGALAWGQSYVLMGFIRMYQAYQDTHYLDRLIHNTDIMLTTRDSERGVTDHQGRSQPAWRAMNPYTAAAVELPGPGGRPVLEVRTARTYGEGSEATVTHEDGGRFTLVLAHARGAVSRYEHLTMDPQSPDNAVRRIYDAYSGTTMCTARRLEGTGGRPDEGTYRLVSRPVIFSVHTGMITYPLASFARIVRQSPRLRADVRYRAKAVEYARAVRDALAVHDAEWQEDGDVGHYRWLKGTPLAYDGNPVPINQTTAVGRTLLEMAAATGSRAYADRAARIAQMFRSQVARDTGGAAIWCYWPTYAPIWKGYAATGDPATDVSLYAPAYGSSAGGAQQIDDCSHAAISVDFAGLARQSRLVIGRDDIRAIARTFTQNMAITDADGVPTVSTRLDGTGEASSGQYLQAPRWIRAGWWDAEVFEHSRAIYDARRPEPGYGSGICAIASLNWFARRGRHPLPPV